jgi:signal transduction histidine kinase/ActR/RegA family two-component response regulator
VVSYQFNALRKDGSAACLLMNSTLLRDDQGNIAGREGTVLDITERRELEQQLLHSQKMDAVGQLAGGVAHDFNNLLMVVSSYAELLLDSLATTDEKAKHQAQEILKAARRAAELTQQLLAFSRKQVLSPRMLDLNALISDFGRMLPRLIGEDIQMVIKPGDSLWKVKADPAQLQQVMMNLAVNARDAMPQGGQLVLEVANTHLDKEYAQRHVGVQPGDFVMLAVSDTGSGIPPEILPHIFEPFFTTKEQGKGTGLGLPTVYGIVKQSGGFVWVYSEVGHGSVFKVYLPRAEGITEQPPEERVAGARPSQGSENILVVEDEEAVREATCEYLASRGYTVLQAGNGADALQVLEQFGKTVHLLITDVVIPGMSGAELGKQVRELRPGTRVLYISGYTENTVVQHGIEAASGFLQKPFTLASLGHKVREVLEAAVPGCGEAESPLDEVM